MKRSDIAFSVASLLVLAAFSFVLISTSQYVGRVASTGVLPNSSLTPGAINATITQATINKTICNPSWSTSSERPSSSYTTALKNKQLASGYNISGDTAPGDYEEDHLISLELGGNPTDPKNLWPESYKTTPNAKNKDAVENYLHTQVCAGNITLADAQKEISGNWIAVYNKLYANGAQKVGAVAEIGIDADDQ